jgi:hypothetical protein
LTRGLSVRILEGDDSCLLDLGLVVAPRAGREHAVT